MLDRRFKSNLLGFCGDLRVPIASQSFVSFHSFCFCNNVSLHRHSLVCNSRAQNQITAYVGGR